MIDNVTCIDFNLDWKSEFITFKYSYLMYGTLTLLLIQATFNFARKVTFWCFFILMGIVCYITYVTFDYFNWNKEYHFNFCYKHYFLPTQPMTGLRCYTIILQYEIFYQILTIDKEGSINSSLIHINFNNNKTILINALTVCVNRQVWRHNICC